MDNGSFTDTRETFAERSCPETYAAAHLDAVQQHAIGKPDAVSNLAVRANGDIGPDFAALAHLQAPSVLCYTRKSCYCTCNPRSSVMSASSHHAHQMSAGSHHAQGASNSP